MALCWWRAERKPLESYQADSLHLYGIDALSKDLKGRGFRFVGSTVIYAHMQAVGMVNDHLVECFRYREVATDIVKPKADH